MSTQYTKCIRCGGNFLPKKDEIKCSKCADVRVSTIHDATIEILLDKNPTIKKAGFKTEIKKLIRKICTEDATYDEEEMQKELAPRWVPDMYEIIEECRTVVAHEVEDTSEIDVERMIKIADLFWYLDSLDIELRLMVYDRYGHNPREINIFKYSFLLGGK